MMDTYLTQPFLKPKSIAIIGASADPKKLDRESKGF